jgi:DNA repair exonuclease SbcCD ATPase subunit
MLISEIGIRGFRSFGNNEQVVKLNTDKGELILLVGNNGNGKSSFLSSFEYTLYGKVRGGRQKKWSTLSTLPNRINGELLNRISFTSNGVEVEVKRGISPNKLELWENGVLNERAGKANIDDAIESYVGLDIETFKSFISMSINDFKNFISLSNEEKQLLLDKLFNLEVINILNSILKELAKNNKVRMASLDAEIRTLDESIASINRSIEKSIEKSIERGKQDIQSEIDRLMTEMNEKKEDYKALKEKVDKIKEKEEILSKEIENEKKQYIIVQGDIKNVQREIDLYDSGKCPTCGTDFDSDHFVALREALVEKKAGFDRIKTEIEGNIAAVKERQTKLKTIADGTQSSYSEMSFFLKNCKTQIEQLNKKKQTVDVVENVDVEEFRRTITELEEKKGRGQDGVATTKDKELYYKELNKIFGEDGVKKSIIAGIIKPINAFIAENIGKMGIPFEVRLDETFTAEIRQFGSTIESDSLSTGENKRVNIAILIAYLKLIRTKRHINILFLDEVFSSIDIEGIDSILTLLKSFANEYNINIFVVHHAILNQEMFDRILKINKEVFSSIEEIDYGTMQNLEFSDEFAE